MQGVAASVIGGGDGIDIANQGQGASFAPMFQPSTADTVFFDSPNGANCDRGQGQALNGCDVGLQWQIDPTGPMPAGRYTDTLRFSIAPK